MTSKSSLTQYELIYYKKKSQSLQACEGTTIEKSLVYSEWK